MTTTTLRSATDPRAQRSRARARGRGAAGRERLPVLYGLAALSLVVMSGGAADAHDVWAAARPVASGPQQQMPDTFRAEIRDRAARPVTLAVPPLSATTGAEETARTMHTVLRNDLHWSMVFDVLDEDLYPEMDSGGGRPDFAAWRQTGATALLQGFVRRRNNAGLVEFRLYDIRSGEQVDGRQYTPFHEDDEVLGEQFRKTAHQFADQAVLHYTGEPGVATTQIAFVSDRGGTKEIWVMDYDGHDPRKITSEGFLALFPAFSPLGDRILYLTYRMHGRMPNEDIGVLQRSGGRAQVIHYSRGSDTSPAWSPDASLIAFSSTRDGNAEIYVSRPDGTDVRRLTFNSAIDTAPTFSPNGRQLAFISTRAGAQHLYMIGIDGANLQRLRVRGGQIDNPSWNPNPNLADLIAYTGSVGGGNLEIFVYSLVEDESHAVTRGFGRDEAPSWSPDGRQIVFESTQGGSTQIYAMGIDGSRLRRLTRDGNNQSPSWGGRYEATRDR